VSDKDAREFKHLLKNLKAKIDRASIKHSKPRNDENQDPA